MKAATQAYHSLAPETHNSRFGQRSYSSGGTDVLSKEDTLGLDDEEVDELVDIANHAVKRRSRDRVVSAGAQLRGEAVVENELAGGLGADGDGESHPGQLERPTDHIEVSSGEDEGDDRDIGNSRGTLRDSCQHDKVARGRAKLTRVLPREELREKGVVVCERLAGGRRVGRGLARGRQVG